MSNKFVSQLAASGNEIKESRANNLAKSVALEMNSKISDLEREVLQLEGEIDTLTDLAPESTDSLRPGSQDFKPAEWVSKLLELKLSIKLKNIELTEARAIKEEWFTESSENQE